MSGENTPSNIETNKTTIDYEYLSGIVNKQSYTINQNFKKYYNGTDMGIIYYMMNERQVAIEKLDADLRDPNKDHIYWYKYTLIWVINKVIDKVNNSTTYNVYQQPFSKTFNKLFGHTKDMIFQLDLERDKIYKPVLWEYSDENEPSYHTLLEKRSSEASASRQAEKDRDEAIMRGPFKRVWVIDKDGKKGGNMYGKGKKSRRKRFRKRVTRRRNAHKKRSTRRR
jgi:hypothetical protein